MPEAEWACSQPRNTLLAKLPETSRRSLPPLELVSLQPGMVLYAPDQTVEYLYFPDNALVSILSAGPDGSTVEIGLVGRDGMIGVPAVLGGVTPYRAVVQTAGWAFRMKGGRLNEEKYLQNKAFHALMLKYINVFLIQVAQSSLCNCYHPLQARVCRWLMVARDAVRSDTICITHDTLSRLLGTRRATVTSTVGLLQKAGILEIARGRITIVDRDGLQEMC